MLPEPNFFTETPHDFFCPSVDAETISDRVCEECGLYFVTKGGAKDHSVAMQHVLKLSTAKQRPRKMVAKRADECLCVMLEQAEMEWLRIDDIVLDVSLVPEVSNGADPVPVIPSIADWIQSPWEEARS